MEKELLEINYDRLVEKALRHVAIEALKLVQKNGLPGDHHYYITFNTRHEGVSIPDDLLATYPTEMTIVLQYQFYDLYVDEKKFGVTLSFNGLDKRLEVPFEAVKYFADPYAKFGLKFNDDELDDLDDEFDEDYDDEGMYEGLEDETPRPAKASGESAQDNVVALDAFRKK